MRLIFLVLPSINPDILLLGNTENGHEEVHSAHILETQSEMRKDVRNLMMNLQDLRAFNQTSLTGEKCSSLLNSIVKLVCAFLRKTQCSTIGESIVNMICPFIPWLTFSGE